LTPSPLAERLADLAVEVGANVQPGQIVTVSAEIGLEEIVRAIAIRAYQQGAKFVDVTYYDPQLKRARIERADGDTLEFVPPWYGERVLELGRSHCARVAVAAPSDPEALKGLDPVRLGRDQLPAIPEWMEVLNERTVNWTIVPYPTQGWARLCYPELDDQSAFDRLSRDIVHVCRLDEPDPAAAWRARVEELLAVGARLMRRGGSGEASAPSEPRAAQLLRGRDRSDLGGNHPAAVHLCLAVERGTPKKHAGRIERDRDISDERHHHSIQGVVMRPLCWWTVPAETKLQSRAMRSPSGASTSTVADSV
jgi:hypothetical protein